MRIPHFLAHVVALSCAVPLFLVLASANAGDTPKERESLQDFLARLRANRESVLHEMRGNVDALVHTLDVEAVPRNIDALDKARAGLVALGPECAPLIVDLVDPGPQSTDPVKLRAQYVTLALAELKSKAVTTRLIEIAQQGSHDGRLNSIKVLGVLEPERVGPVLVGLYRGGTGDLRNAALVALAHVAGPEVDKVFDEALSDSHADVVDGALAGLAAGHRTSLSSRILRLVATATDAVHHVPKIVEYYRACPETVDKAHVQAMIRLLEEPSASADDRLRILELLPSFPDKFDAEARKEMRAVSELPTKDLREGALVVLVLVGDRTARKELLADYDEQIDKNKTWANSYEARGNILYRIADYREAIVDFGKAIKLSSTDLAAHQDGAYIGLARCYGMTNKFKEASDTLRKAPLTPKQVEALRKDPAFAKMVDNPKYRDFFQPK